MTPEKKNVQFSESDTTTNMVQRKQRKHVCTAGYEGVKGPTSGDYDANGARIIGTR